MATSATARWLPRGNRASSRAAVALSSPRRTSSSRLASSCSAIARRRHTQLLWRRRSCPIAGCVRRSSRWRERTAHASSISSRPERLLACSMATFAEAAFPSRRRTSSVGHVNWVAASRRLKPSTTSNSPRWRHTSTGASCPCRSIDRLIERTPSGARSRSLDHRVLSVAIATTSTELGWASTPSVTMWPLAQARVVRDTCLTAHPQSGRITVGYQESPARDRGGRRSLVSHDSGGKYRKSRRSRAPGWPVTPT